MQNPERVNLAKVEELSHNVEGKRHADMKGERMQTQREEVMQMWRE